MKKTLGLFTLITLFILPLPAEDKGTATNTFTREEILHPIQPEGRKRL